MGAVWPTASPVIKDISNKVLKDIIVKPEKREAIKVKFNAVKFETFDKISSSTSLIKMKNG